MSIKKDDIKRLVEIKYSNTFKVYYINSVDGVKTTKPIGCFVSLGMTSSMEKIKDIANWINLEGEYTAEIAEISSVKKDENNYINTITKLGVDSISQYELKNLDKSIMDRKKSIDELNRLKAKSKKETNLGKLSDLVIKSNKLKDLIDILDESEDNGWNHHSIQRDKKVHYSIYHKFVNYEKVGDIEKRIGIYIR